MYDDPTARVHRIYEFWGRHSQLYAAQDWVTFLGRPHEIRRRAIEALQVGPGARVLELACGTGRNFPYIEDLIGARGTLVGFDYSDAMLAAAAKLVNRHRWRNVRLVQGDAAQLELDDESPFDGIVCVLGLSAIPGYTDALYRCHDLLEVGRILAVCDAQPFAGHLRMLNPLLRLLYEPLTGWDPARDLVGAMGDVFGAVAVERLNFGSLYVATAMKSK